MPADFEKLVLKCKCVVVFSYSTLPPVSLSPSLHLSLFQIHLMTDIWIAHGSVLLITAAGAVGEKKRKEME